MTDEQKRILEAATRKGKTVWFRDKITGKPIRWGTVEDEVYVLDNDYKHLIQRIRYAEEGSSDSPWIGYRTGYYTFDKNMKHVKWGQYSQCLSEEKYRDLLGEAKTRGWPIF
jgi:hypothetical protein